MAKKNKLISCKHCGEEIAASAKVCPHCGGKNKKPIYKKWWFWVIVIIVIIAIMPKNDTKPDTTAVPETTAPVLQEVVKETEKATVEDDSTEAQPAETEAPTETEPEDTVPSEFKSALKKAKTYSSLMNMSKQGIFDQLTSEYGEKFPEDAATYAIENLDVDWNQNALKKAEDYCKTMHMSKRGVYDQLISEFGEKFTEEEAQYAIDHLDVDWNELALKSAQNYQSLMDMSRSAIYDQLVSEYGEKFTAEEAQYAIDHLD